MGGVIKKTTALDVEKNACIISYMTEKFNTRCTWLFCLVANMLVIDLLYGVIPFLLEGVCAFAPRIKNSPKTKRPDNHLIVGPFLGDPAGIRCCTL